MKRAAQIGVVLAVLGGCASPSNQPPSVQTAQQTPGPSRTGEAGPAFLKKPEPTTSQPVYVVLASPQAPVAPTETRDGAPALKTQDPSPTAAANLPSLTPVAGDANLAHILSVEASKRDSAAPAPTLVPTVAEIRPALPDSLPSASASALANASARPHIPSEIKTTPLQVAVDSAPNPSLPEPKSIECPAPAASAVQACVPQCPELTSKDPKLVKLTEPQCPIHMHVTDKGSNIRVVNSKRFNLQYELKGVGPSGVNDIELWYTRDGNTWQKHPSRHAGPPPYVVEVEDEDLFGFTLVVHSGVGLSKRPPQSGDFPQTWVEVDLTKPNVRLLGVETGKDADARNLTILWRATDRNLGTRPIALSYAAKPEGPWLPIAKGTENTGRYVWHMPNEIPRYFFIRVEATDLAGNVGLAQTPNPLLGDLSQPTASILAVEQVREGKDGQ